MRWTMLVAIVAGCAEDNWLLQNRWPWEPPRQAVAQPAPQQRPAGPPPQWGAFGQPFGQTPAAYGGQPAMPAQQATCSSDYECGGGRCVKPNYSAVGSCMTAVNGDGVQTYQPPDPGSVNVKTPSRSDCKTDTDCATGFHCNVASGACIR